MTLVSRQLVWLVEEAARCHLPVVYKIEPLRSSIGPVFFPFPPISPQIPEHGTNSLSNFILPPSHLLFPLCAYVCSHNRDKSVFRPHSLRELQISLRKPLFHSVVIFGPQYSLPSHNLNTTDLNALYLLHMTVHLTLVMYILCLYTVIICFCIFLYKLWLFSLMVWTHSLCNMFVFSLALLLINIVASVCLVVW